MFQLPTTLWHVVAGAIVLVFPGLALSLCLKKKNKDILEILSDTIGLSISVTALLALFAYLVGWRFSAIDVVVFYLVAGLFMLISLGRSAARPWRTARFFAPLSIFGILIIWRFYQASELILPAWVDSLHHVLIVKVILENGGIPSTMDPYLPIPFYYHFAFHLLAGIFSFMSGLAPENAVLGIGQVLNAAVALSIYRLGIALWDDRWRAALAALLVGFVSTMPAYYVSWGRYTLLVGLVLLPLAMAAALDIFRKGASVPRAVHLSLLTGGLLLAHYFAAILLAVFLVILGVQTFIQDIRQANLLKGNRWLYLITGAVGGAALAGVWIVRTWIYANRGISISAIVSTEVATNLYFPDYLSYLWRLLGPGHNYLLMGLAGLGLILAIWQTKTRAFALWSICLVLMSQPWGLNISPFRPDHGVIILFLPVGLLASTFLINSGERFLSGRLVIAGNILLVMTIGMILIWGVISTRTIINPATVLASQADLQALEWIKEDIPEDARFFINVAYWQNRSYRGVDGGWWITPLTGRDTLLPPVIYVMGEIDYVEKVLEQGRKGSQLEGCTLEMWELIEDAGLTHIYLNRTVGPLYPDSLADCPGLTILYEKDGVFIYEIGRQDFTSGY
jgi:hypothetical protein